MRKRLGLLEGVAIILGIIFGSGIFISPKKILEKTGSVWGGGALIVWTVCGVLATLGAMSYAELDPVRMQLCRGTIDPLSQKLLAAATICFLTFINAYDVKFTTRVQNIFMFTKIIALVIIIIGGIVWMSEGGVASFEDGWAGTKSLVNDWSFTFYSGIFSHFDEVIGINLWKNDGIYSSFSGNFLHVVLLNLLI